MSKQGSLLDNFGNTPKEESKTMTEKEKEILKQLKKIGKKIKNM